jgi:Ca2+-binding RTX toxin-like protein
MSGENNPGSVDGVVDGTTGDDLIDLGYLGDPEGDRIDNNDAIFPDHAPNDDVVMAGEGNDTVEAGVGDDTVFGGDGDDVIYGEEGDDVVKGQGGNDTLIGGDGNDTLLGGDGKESVDGGDGDDLIDTRFDTNLPLPDLGYPSLYPSDADPLDGMDTVTGGAGNDTIYTGDDADDIQGGAGDDYIDGGFDRDTILGDGGNDTIIGGEGSDQISAGEGDDLVYGGLGPGFPDSVNITDDGSDGNPLGPDAVPDNGRDTIDGGAGNDTIYGEDDDDLIHGGTGDDLLDGGIDEDTIHGGEGNDTIIGGQGNDSLEGGADRDVFEGGFNAGDFVDGSGTGDDYDTLDLTGSGPLRVAIDPTDPEAGTVTFYDGGGFEASNIIGTMEFEEIENIVPCFTPGSRIATPRGEVMVENLQAGDKIITRDNGIQEIRWVGSKTMNHAELRRAPHLRPILIKAGSLGEGLPERDMLVSPQHRMLVANDRTSLYFEESEVLVAAKHLVNHNGVQWMDTLRTTYIHFMVDRHEVVLADGAWTESFQPGDMTLEGMGNSQRNEIFELFPDLRETDGRDAYVAARKVLKSHEARLIVR